MIVQMPNVIIHGRRSFQLEPDKLTIRPRGLDQLMRVMQSDREDTYSHSTAVEGRPHMRIKEVETTTEVPGQAYVHRIQAEGLATVADKIEASRIRQPEEGWDEGPMEVLTTNPGAYAAGALLPGHESMWIVGTEKEDINGHVWRVSLEAKGMVVPKARKRRITGNTGSKNFTANTILGYVPGSSPAFTPFVNEAGAFTGWTTALPTNMDTSTVVVVDTLLTTTPPPTDKIPGHLTPENAPPVHDIWGYPWNFTDGVFFNWPWGWTLKSIQSEQLLDKAVWLTSITTEFVPRIIPK
jgi:hypothetical protein